MDKMTRDEILARVFSNSGLREMGDVPSRTLPSPSELYPYSKANQPPEMYSAELAEGVSPPPVEWFGGKSAGGFGFGLPIPTPATQPFEDVEFNQNFNAYSVPQSAENANQKAAENAAQQAQEKINKQKATKPLIADQPLEKPQIKTGDIPQMVDPYNQRERVRNAFSDRIKQEDKIDITKEYPEVAQYEEPLNVRARTGDYNMRKMAQNAFDLQRKQADASMEDKIDITKEYPEAAQYVEPLNVRARTGDYNMRKIAQNAFDLQRKQTDASQVDAISSAAPKSMGEQIKPQQRQSFLDYALNYQTRKNEAAIANPLAAAGVEIGSAALAAPAVAGLGAVVSSALTPVGNIIPTTTGKILQFAPKAASAAAAAALPSRAAAEGWNAKTQKYTQPTKAVNNKAAATGVNKAVAKPVTTPNVSPSTAAANAQNLLNKLSNAIKGLNIGR